MAETGPRGLLVVFLAALALTGSAGGATSGLHGVVTIGPTTPVCRIGTPCSKPAAGVVLTFSRPRHRTTVRTGTAGGYRVALSAGTWAVHASSGMRIGPASVVVRAGRNTLRNFAIDTGIR
jgi:hypothetical protein